MPGGNNFGFGAPQDDPDENGYFANGFGDVDVDWENGENGIGFGDPEGVETDQLFLLPFGSSIKVYPDDGGIVAELLGNFSATGSQYFRVKVADSATGELFPKAPLLGCKAVKVNTQNQELRPELDGQRLRFAVPPLPPAVYDVYVYYGPGFAAVMPAYVGAFRVVRRHWSDEVHRIRNKLPSVYSAAVRAVGEEPMLGG